MIINEKHKKEMATKPQIPNIIFKSLLWLNENKCFDEVQYLLQNYSLTVDQRQVLESTNKLARKIASVEHLETI